MKEGDLENFNNPIAEKNKKKRRVLILHIDYPESGEIKLHETVKLRATLRIKEREEQISTEVKSITINGANSLNDSVSDFFNWLKEGSTSEIEEPPILEIIHHGFNPDREETEEVRSGAYLGKKLCKHVDFEKFGYFELNAISCFFARENNEGISQLDQLLIELMKHGAKHFVGCGSRETISIFKQENDLDELTESELVYMKQIDILLKENESDPFKLSDKLEEEVILLYETFEKLLIDFNKYQKKYKASYNELERERKEAIEALNNLDESLDLFDNETLSSLVDLSSHVFYLKKVLSTKKYRGFFLGGRIVTEKDVKDAEITYNEAYIKAIESITDSNELETIVNYMEKYNKRHNTKYESELQEMIFTQKILLKNEAYKAYTKKKDLLEFYLKAYFNKELSLLRDKYPNIKIPAGYDYHLRQIKTKDGRFIASGVAIGDEVDSNGNFVANVYYSPTLDSEQPQLVKILTPDGLKTFIEKHKAAANQRNSGQSSELNSGQSAQNSRTP